MKTRDSWRVAAVALLLAGLSVLSSARAQDTNAPTGSPVPATNNVSAAGGTNVMQASFLNSMDVLDDKYKLLPSDRLSFRVVEDEEDSKPLPVVDSGEVEVPYIGRFPAAGKTCKELALAIKTELEKEYYYHATVILAVDLKAKSHGKVYLSGAGVRTVGALDLPTDEALTATKAILRAGGFTASADRRNIQIVREPGHPGGGDRRFTVNAVDVIEKGKLELDLKLEPGDRIHVREREFHIW